MNRRFLLATALVAGCASQRAAAPAPVVGPDVGKRVVAEHGVVASGTAYASEAGLEMLRRGGNAVDAAVATAFALGVTEPMMSGLGAGGGMLIWNQRAKRAEYVNFYSAEGAVPDTGLRALRGSITTRGVGIPGAVAGLLDAQARYGKLPRAAVLEPAIRLAADGFTATSLLAREVHDDSAKVSRYEGARRIFLPAGHPVRAGDRVVQPELAATLRLVAAQGPDVFYKGTLAQTIVDTLRAGGSTLTTDDFASYRPRWERPLCSTYRGRVVLSAPAPQSGMQVLEALNLLEPHDLPALGLPTRSPAAFRLLAGAMRVSVADRDAFVGDAKYSAVPQAGVVSKQFAAARQSEVAHLSGERQPAGNPWAADAQAPSASCAPFQPMGPAAAPRRASAGAPGDGSLAETTHMSVVDDEGNAVSVTNTLGLGFGTGTWVNGVFFNSALFNFSRNDSGPNAIGSNRVPASTISPTIVLRNDAVDMVVGSPGSAAIPPAVIETIVYSLDYGLDPYQALRMPRVIPTSGATMRMEAGFAGEVFGEAKRLGFDVLTTPPIDMSFGGVTVISRLGGRWVGAADPRRDGEVRGY